MVLGQHDDIDDAIEFVWRRLLEYSSTASAVSSEVSADAVSCVVESLGLETITVVRGAHTTTLNRRGTTKQREAETAEKCPDYATMRRVARAAWTKRESQGALTPSLRPPTEELVEAALDLFYLIVVPRPEGWFFGHCSRSLEAVQFAVDSLGLSTVAVWRGSRNTGGTVNLLRTGTARQRQEDADRYPDYRSIFRPIVGRMPTNDEQAVADQVAMGVEPLMVISAELTRASEARLAQEEAPVSERRRELVRQIEEAHARHRAAAEKRAARGSGDAVPVRRLPFEPLPPGSWTMDDVVNHYTTVAHRLPSGLLGRSIQWERLRQIESLGPNVCYVGDQMWLGYTVFTFAYTQRAVLECPIEGNATYVLSGDWKCMARYSKQEMRQKYPKGFAKVVHRGDWLSRVRTALRAGW
jgi:hypothetical protein